MCLGLAVTPKLVDVFEELPPSAVEISLCGTTAETYEKITRIPGAFRCCVRGIRRLVDAGVKVRINMVLMTLNVHEFDLMRRSTAVVHPGQ
jgi:MoaA/NifB/PqqE/SkfB family radical SAM enzyme